MRRTLCTILLATLALVLPIRSAGAATLRCAADSVKVGPVCVDKYEASLWKIPASETGLIRKVESGKADLDDLLGGGAVQVGDPSPPFNLAPVPGTFPENGNWTAPLYAVSIPGVFPSSAVTWFQAEQGCRLAGKRLVTNQDWQAAAAGTPDSGTDDGSTLCNTGLIANASMTGSRSACVSKWGAFDMVGNVTEWVGDWDEETDQTCDDWGTAFGSDVVCIGGPGGGGLPGPFLRGGDFLQGTDAGVFALNSTPATDLDDRFGFRCAR